MGQGKKLERQETTNWLKLFFKKGKLAQGAHMPTLHCPPPPAPYIALSLPSFSLSNTVLSHLYHLLISYLSARCPCRFLSPLSSPSTLFQLEKEEVEAERWRWRQQQAGERSEGVLKGQTESRTLCQSLHLSVAPMKWFVLVKMANTFPIHSCNGRSDLVKCYNAVARLLMH